MENNNLKNMLNDSLSLEKIRKIALTEAKVILKEAGISENDKCFPLMLYEMNFKIYHAIKEVMKYHKK